MPAGLNINIANAAAEPREGVVVFCILRNERYFLRYFFEYYRNIGAGSFLIYDDRSDIGTVDYLTSQPDCTILRSDSQFGDTFGVDGLGVPRRLPMILKESVPESLLSGRWVLTVDADEFLVLPAGFAGLDEFVAFLDSIRKPYATAPMVDFYGETLDSRNYDRNLSPFAGNPYFDAGPYYYWTGGLSAVPFGGGIRYRLLEMLCQKHPDRINGIFDTFLPAPGKSWKVPLLKHGYGARRIGDHEISLEPTADVSAAIAHFKFTPDLDEKIERALKERQYFGGSVEYRFLKATIELLGGETLIGAETRRFDGPQSLELAGLITMSADLAGRRDKMSH